MIVQNKKIYSVAECSELLKVNQQRVRALIKSGRIQAVKVGKNTWAITDFSGAIERRAGRPVKTWV